MDIEDNRLQLPLNSRDEDCYPIGFGISFNSQSQFEFGNFGVQEPSPLVLSLTDNGTLCTFYAVNSKEKQTISRGASQMAFKEGAPKIGKHFNIDMSYHGRIIKWFKTLWSK